MMPSSSTMASPSGSLLCRDTSALTLSKLLPPGAHSLPKCVVVTGPPRCGKSTLASSVIRDLQHLKAAQASCQQGTIHPKSDLLFFLSIIIVQS